MKTNNGFILLNKKKGVSSHSALTPLKKLMPKKTKIGHTGTLDPNATGLLVVAIGRAAKFIQYLGNSPKKYRAGFCFGVKTDSGDIWGNVIEEKITDEGLSQEYKITKLKELKESIKYFIGEIEQIPPMYSAIKKNGKALYKYAREGIEVERKSRKIDIFNIDIIEFDYPNVIIDIECSKGTYIRTLIEDVCQKMNEIACMTTLIRVCSDSFDISNSCSIDYFKSEDDIINRLISIEEVFSHLPKIRVDNIHKKHIQNGVPVNLNRFIKDDKTNLLGYYSVIDSENNMFALAKRSLDEFKTLINI